MDWNDERIAALKQLWANGLSASQIAGRLGIGRGAVTSKVSRLGLPHRLTVYTTPRSRKFSPVQVQSQLPLPLAPTGRKTIETLGDHDCRWPIGDPKLAGFHFCGSRKLPGLPYCEPHFRAAYVPVPPRRIPSIMPVVAPARVVEEVA